MILISVASFAQKSQFGTEKIDENKFLESVKKSNSNTAKASQVAINENLSFENIPTYNIGDSEVHELKEIKLTIKENIPVPVGHFIPKDESHFNLALFTIEQGNLSNFNLYVHLSKQNELWISTRDRGVFRYNGNSIIYYNESNGFRSNSVNHIYEDQENNIWFCTLGQGLIKYNGFEFVQIDTSSGLPTNYINAVEVDNNGKIWVGTARGLSLIEGDSVKSFPNLIEETMVEVKDLCQDRKGNLWIATWRNGLLFLKPNLEVGKITPDDGLGTNNLVALEAGEKTIHIGTYGKGLLTYNYKALYSIETELLDWNLGVMRAIWEDEEQRIWFGTDGGNVYCFDNNQISIIQESDGLSGKPISAITGDNKGNIWITTFGGGIAAYKENSFTNYFESDGIGRGQINCSFQDSQGNIWFGSWGGGLVKFNGENFYHFRDDKFFGNNIITAIAEDADGNLWFSTFASGILTYKDGYFSNFADKAGSRATDIIFEPEGTIVSNVNGLVDFRYGKVRKISAPIDSIQQRIYCLTKIGNNLLIGTDNGAYFGDTSLSKWEKTFPTIGGLYDIKLIDDQLWLHSENGLFTIDANNIDAIPNSIYNEKLRGFEVDNTGNVWIGTGTGLKWLNISENDTSIIEFGSKNGQRGVDFSKDAFLIDNKNRLWFATENALSQYPLFIDISKEDIPKAKILAIEINNKQFDLEFEGNLIFDNPKRFSSIPENLNLAHDLNNLTIHYSGTDWHNPYDLYYESYLEGLETEWNRPTKDIKVSYTNLSYGTYVFHLRAISKNNSYSETLNFSFTIEAPWWHTWWARALYLILGLIIIWLVVKQRTAKLKKRQEELEKEVELATSKIREQKNEVERQKHVVEEAHREITDSINYAERIQRSFMATEDLLAENLNEFFVYFNPKEAVSGDFYWAGKLENGNFALSCADSTGHGVPGAIMSILNISAIEKAVELGITEPSEIFNAARKTIIERLRKDGSEEGGKDGMDASLIAFNESNSKIKYVAAHNPIWIIRKAKGDSNRTELIEIKAEKMPVGKHEHDKIPFVGGEIDIQKGDVIYSLTDGFQDQFGGAKGKKFKVKPLKNLLLENAHLPMKEQEALLSNTLETWKGELEQVDDICIVGVRV